MTTLFTWANHNDARKLVLFTLTMLPLMLIGVVSEDGFLPIILLEAVLCGYMAYWLGNWKWLFLPLLAMGVEIVCLLPGAMQGSGAGETPFSIILEAPFWAGIPTLIGASIGYLAKRIGARQ